jgi:hypothetical protein
MIVHGGHRSPYCSRTDALVIMGILAGPWTRSSRIPDTLALTTGGKKCCASPLVVHGVCMRHQVVCCSS